jgi:hypothetical protein
VRMRLKKLNTFRGSHSHTVRLVGTYVVGFDFCILLYPVTQYNLETFMGIVYEERLLSLNPRDHATGTEIEAQAGKLRLWYFFGCLAYAVHYIHLKATKHMDIKPKNLLVRDIARPKRNMTCLIRFTLQILAFPGSTVLLLNQTQILQRRSQGLMLRLRS